MIQLQLFITFIKVGLFSIGGYASIPIIQQEVIKNYQWLSNSTYIDILAISQITPGPIGINVATFTGMSIYGLIGAILATIGFVLPSIFIVSAITHLYLKHSNLGIIQYIFEKLRPVMVAVIFYAGIKILIEAFNINDSININIIRVILFTLSLFLLEKYKLSIIKLLLIMIIFNIGLYYFI